MTPPLEISAMDKEFPTSTGKYVALRDVRAVVHENEFVCLLGHSGCGKSTVLSIIAGLQKATSGGVLIDGVVVDEPGMDRGVVFQSPALLPWLTAGENIRLAVKNAFPKLTSEEGGRKVQQIMELLGIIDCKDQLPTELSLGTQQCVSLARAFSMEPRFLLLDEPFSMLDSLTRLALQDTLLQVWEETRNIVVMVTHDIDEALYLADRLVLMTDGPEARVGADIQVSFPRPRNREGVLVHPEYYRLRTEILDFLASHSRQFDKGSHEVEPQIMKRV